MPAFLWANDSLPASQQAQLNLTADERAAMLDFLRRLVQTPSHSTQEGTVAQIIIDELKAVGIPDVTVDRTGNVIARLGSGEGPTLLFDAHMDTVEPTGSGWRYDPYSAQVEDGMLYGLGSCATKSSIAAIVYAAKRLVESEALHNGRLIMAFVVQQEPCEGCGIRALLADADIAPDYVLLGDPSHMQIMRGHRGRVMFKVTVRGRSSHASNPEQGHNAITDAARLIFGIDLMSADLPGDPFLGPGTVVVTHIESHAPGLNAIPDTCTFYVDRRLTLGETPTRAQVQIESVVGREGIDATLEILSYEAASYTGYVVGDQEAFTAWALDANHPLIAELRQAIETVQNQTPRVGHWPFSTDGVYTMSERGIPTVGFGPGDPALVHTAEERVSEQDVINAAHIYALFVSQILG